MPKIPFAMLKNSLNIFGKSLVGVISTLGLAILISSPALAQEDASPQIEQWENELAALELELDIEGQNEAGAANIVSSANGLKTRVNSCVTSQESQILQIESDLEVIGERPTESAAPSEDIDQDETTEPPLTPEITDEEAIKQAEETKKHADELHLIRLGMENDITQKKITVQECRFLILRIDKVIRNAARLQQTLSAARLSSQSGRLMVALANNLKEPGLAAALAIEKIVTDKKRTGLTTKRLFKLAGFILIASLLGYATGRLLIDWSTKQRGRGGEATFLTVFSRHLYDYMPLIIGSGIGSTTLFIYSQPDPIDSIIFRFSLALFLFAISRVFVRWIVGPISPGSTLMRAPELPAIAQRRFNLLIGSILLGFVIFSTNALTTTLDPTLYSLRALLVLFFATTLIHLVNAAKLIPSMRGKLVPLRILLIIAALGAVIADYSGYRNLANHLIAAMLVTIGSGVILWTLLWLFKTLLHGLIHGTSNVSYQVRSWMGMRPSETRSELGWLRLILSFSLWILFAGTLISAWDPSGNVVPMITSQISHGIPIGQDTTLVLKDIVIGLAVFALILAITTWMKARLSTRWLRDTGMDRGAREAVVTLGGYVGFIIAALMGLTLAGVDFKGLAYVLTALSLGIGFGLQNIVSNFVSGLILLFERPIKSGDFVSVGQIEGIIKQIRIRSTEIETLDRQTVIVPNSELVANQVTNWVLHDPYGRITLNVGVAYGSDTDQVKSILEDVASAHAEVLSKGPTPTPRALFNSFGDSSLDFELRVWIRHIEKRFNVTSDLNFAIDKAFRAAGIEIPFPQRDLHVTGWPQDTASTEAPRNDTPEQNQSTTDEDDNEEAPNSEDK